MNVSVSYFERIFYFNFEARTSRGRLPHRKSWFIKITSTDHPHRFGIGEVAPLPGLSKEYNDVEDYLKEVVACFQQQKCIPQRYGSLSDLKSLRDFLCSRIPLIEDFSSVIFAIETAILDLQNGGRRILFDNNFVRGVAIPINGLVWMNDATHMLQQAKAKIAEGFRIIKCKVGALDFEQECYVLSQIRKIYHANEVSIRLDANGAFLESNVLQKLHVLSQFDIHSIEQPLPSRSTLTSEICQNSPIHIALDEELIGLDSIQQKNDILNRLSPYYIVLKPTLHGGLYGCLQWIQLATAKGIGWWATSALESHIGLNAIAQFVSNFSNLTVQGLGTGGIYCSDFTSPLAIHGGKLVYLSSHCWNEAEMG